MPAPFPLARPSSAWTPLRVRAIAALRLLRPRQWTKNLVCLLPLFCAGVALDGSRLALSFLTFVAFCLGASFVYIVNDLHDIRRDQLHPRKRYRPLAAGTLSRASALGLAAIVLALCATAAASVSLSVLGILLGYIVLNLAYSVWLKHVAILDVMLISAGFLLRLGAGGQAGGVSVSAWLNLCAFFLSLFLAFSKRRAELNGPSDHRKP